MAAPIPLEAPVTRAVFLDASSMAPPWIHGPCQRFPVEAPRPRRTDFGHGERIFATVVPCGDGGPPAQAFVRGDRRRSRHRPRELRGAARLPPAAHRPL